MTGDRGLRRIAFTALMLGLAVMFACGSSESPSTATPLMFEAATGDFFFTDSTGNRVIYEWAENTLIVEPDIDVEQLAVAFCRAEQETSEPARFAAVSLVLAEALFPFVSTVERVCDR